LTVARYYRLFIKTAKNLKMRSIYHQKTDKQAIKNDYSIFDLNNEKNFFLKKR